MRTSALLRADSTQLPLYADKPREARCRNTRQAPRNGRPAWPPDGYRESTAVTTISTRIPGTTSAITAVLDRLG